MFATLLNVQSGESVGLQQYIDNRCGKLRVAVRSFNFWVGWYNLQPGEWIAWRLEDGPTLTLDLTPGLYSADLLIAALTAPVPGLTMEVDKASGVLSLIVPTDYQILLSDGVKKLLGFDDEGWFVEGAYLGDRPIDFMPQSALHVHLDQLSSATNTVDGAPSSLLAIFPAPRESFGEVVTFTPPSPEFKNLCDGTINDLKVRVTDSHQRLVDNHGQPITITLEFR